MQLLLATSAAVAALVPAAPAAAACKPGTHKFGGTQAQTFCGPARASLTMAGKHVSFKQGSCKRTSDYFTINIGTIVLGDTTKKRPAYFGITVGKTVGGGSPANHDGTYTKDLTISFVTGGHSYALIHATLTLAGHRTKGTFTGGLLAGGGDVSGSFHC